MSVDFLLLLLLHVGKSSPVYTLHHMVCLPSAHLHYIRIRDPEHVRDTYIVVPQAVQGKILGHFGVFNGSSKPTGKSVGVSVNNSLTGQIDSIHDLLRKGDNPVGCVILGFRHFDWF